MYVKKYNDVLFIFTAGNLSDSTSVNITVNHVNRPPVMNAITAQATNENDSLVFTVNGDDPEPSRPGELRLRRIVEAAVTAAATMKVLGFFIEISGLKL